MLYGFFDASGHERNQPCIVVAGFVSSDKDWKAFSEAWRERLRRDELPYFHMVEFAHSRGAFKEGWAGNEQRRRSLLADLMGIIKSHVYRMFVEVVENDALNERLSEGVRREYYLRAFSLAGRTCAAKVREWLTNERWSTELQLVFEEGDLGKGDLSNRLEQDGFKKPLFRPALDVYSEEGHLITEGSLPLQAADFVAYEFFLAMKKMSEDRWAFKEFSRIPGRMGFYSVRNLRELDEKFRTLSDTKLTERAILGEP